MTFESLLKMKDFNSKIATVEKDVKNYLNKENYQVDRKRVRELVQWSHTVKGQKVVKLVYANERCPKNIKEIINNFIQKEFSEE